MDVFKRLRKPPDKYIRNRSKPVADWGKRDGARVDDHLQCRICCEGALHQMWLILIFRANVRLDGFLGEFSQSSGDCRYEADSEWGT